MTEEQRKAFDALHNFIRSLSEKAGKAETYAEQDTSERRRSEGTCILS